jgi:hypothetical protein
MSRFVALLLIWFNKDGVQARHHAGDFFGSLAFASLCSSLIITYYSSSGADLVPVCFDLEAKLIGSAPSRLNIAMNTNFMITSIIRVTPSEEVEALPHSLVSVSSLFSSSATFVSTNVCSVSTSATGTA